MGAQTMLNVTPQFAFETPARSRAEALRRFEGIMHSEQQLVALGTPVRCYINYD